MTVTPNSLPIIEDTKAPEVSTELGAVALEEYVSPGAVVEVQAESITLGVDRGFGSDQAGYKPIP